MLRMKRRIYIETSVISYLAARPSLDAVNAARQYESLRLWSARDQFELVISSLVRDEASDGDAFAAAQRLRLLDGLEHMPATAEAVATAKALIAQQVFPAKAYADALHVAIAAHHGCDGIASWNYRHIASAWARQRVEANLRQLGLSVPMIATPDAFLETQNDD
jgi:predicted nucleic acid-binding protein